VSKAHFYVVDRVEGEHAVLVGDGGDDHVVKLRDLPRDAKEGAVFRVSRDSKGNLDWGTAEIDEREAARRRRMADEVLRDLRRRDPGGDIEL